MKTSVHCLHGRWAIRNPCRTQTVLTQLSQKRACSHRIKTNHWRGKRPDKHRNDQTPRRSTTATVSRRQTSCRHMRSSLLSPLAFRRCHCWHLCARRLRTGLHGVRDLLSVSRRLLYRLMRR